MLVADPEIRAAVGDVAFERGRRYAERGDVVKTVWNARELVLIGQVQGSSPFPYTTVVELARHGAELSLVRSSCTCPVRVLCKHAAAVLLAPERSPAPGAPTVPAWQSSLDRALDSGGAVRSRARGSALALLVELTTDRDDQFRLRARPVARSAAGRWVKSGISWDVVNRRHHYGIDASHAAALASVYRAAHDDVPWASAPTSIWLDQGGPGLWPALLGLVDAGVELTSDVPVTLSPEPAGIVVDLRSADDGALDMGVHVRVGDQDVDPDRMLLIGRDAASGVCWWDDATLAPRPGRALRGQDPRPAHLVLAPFDPPASDAATALLRDVAHLRVPAAETSRFLRTYYPRLAAHARVGSSDGSVTPPELPAPTLRCGSAPSQGTSSSRPGRGSTARPTAASRTGSASTSRRRTGATLPRRRRSRPTCWPSRGRCSTVRGALGRRALRGVAGRRARRAGGAHAARRAGGRGGRRRGRARLPPGRRARPRSRS